MQGNQEKRGSIAFFPTYRPPLPLDIYSCPGDVDKSEKLSEIHLTDHADSYNQNARLIPPPSLKTLLKRPIFANSEFKEAHVDSGRLSGLIFVSERGETQLELLHIALRFNDNSQVKVFTLADIFPAQPQFTGVRLEDSGCFAGDYLVFVSTKEPAPERRQPWTAVYKTNLKTGKTERLTLKGKADLSPSVSPSGKVIAVASFQRKDGGWTGEIEDLQTNIYVMNVDGPLNRKLVVKNGGWPTWGSDNVIFFHRRFKSDVLKNEKEEDNKLWGVYRAYITDSQLASKGNPDIKDTPRVTPDGIDARTPAAINDTKVAVATIRKKSGFSDIRDQEQYRHIEIFEYSTTGQQVEPKRLTVQARPKADHFNPFVIDGGKRIGYHRCKSDLLKSGDDIPRQFHKLVSPHPDVGLFRVSGVFPTFSKDGSKLAFVDNEFKALWVADSKGLRIVFNTRVDNFFSPVWSQDPKKDILYVCVGPSFNAAKELMICAIKNVSGGRQQRVDLTRPGSNNAFPSTSPDGTKLVFRSTRDGGDKRHKNLYIMENAQVGEYGEGKITRLTNGDWTDTHCQWSPRGDWIVFSSTRDKPQGAPDLDNGLDPGYFTVFLVKWNDPSVVVRVAGSGNDLGGHMNHPFFSPDGKSIVVTADLAAVSADPVSLPLFVHSVRPYGDIFAIDIDSDDINKNKDVKNFSRITHSRYEYSTASWTMFSTEDPNAAWNLQLSSGKYTPACPYAYPDGGESWHMTGHLCIPKRCC